MPALCCATLFFHVHQQLAHLSPSGTLPLPVWYCWWTTWRRTSCSIWSLWTRVSVTARVWGAFSGDDITVMHPWGERNVGIWLLFSCWCQRGKEGRNISVLQVTVPPARTAVTTKEMHFLTLLVGAWFVYSWRDKHTVEYKKWSPAKGFSNGVYTPI